ncbi:Bud site selection protein 6 [Ceratobasidium sp. 395]|nr:Bud site selection protein 6 [Ceratobasidium sp. 395]
MPNTRFHSQLGRTVESLTSETHLLLQLLADWSHGDATKPEIYDGYVNMVMAFIACTYAFEEHGVDMSTARIAPQHIWGQLERMLAMEAAPQTGEIYLPSIQSSAQLLIRDLRAKRRESYQLSRTRKRGSLTSNESSNADTVVEMEREKALLCLNGQGKYRDSGAECRDVVVPARRTAPEDSSNTKVSASSSSTTLDGLLSSDSGEKYVCATCGTICLEPIQDAVDSFTSTLLELKGLLELWRRDPALAVNLYLSCMRVSQDYEAAIEVFGNKGAYIGDLKPVMEELKTVVKKAAYFPYRCGHENLRTQILSDAFRSINQLNRSLKSRQRKYMLKHAPGIVPSIVHLLSCLGTLSKTLLQWSYRRIDTNRVDCACGTLHRALNVVVSAFYARGVDVSGLVHSLPSELSQILHGLLTEEPSPENWKKYQPTIGAIIKKLLKSVLDLNMDNHMAVEVWWSLISPSDWDGTSNLGTALTNDDLKPAANPLTTVLDEISTMPFPQVVPALTTNQGVDSPVLGARHLAFGSVPLSDKRGASLVLLIPTSTVLADEFASDLPASSTPRASKDYPARSGSISTTLRRMSGRISSMFNLRDVKDRYRR